MVVDGVAGFWMKVCSDWLIVIVVVVVCDKVEGSILDWFYAMASESSSLPHGDANGGHRPTSICLGSACAIFPLQLKLSRVL